MVEHIEVGLEYIMTYTVGPLMAGSKVLCVCKDGVGLSGLLFEGIVRTSRYTGYALLRAAAGTQGGHNGSIIDCPDEYAQAHWWVSEHRDLPALAAVNPMDEVAKWAKLVEEAAKRKGTHVV